MRSLTRYVLVALLPIALTSCFWNKDETKNNGSTDNNTAQSQLATPEAIAERARINKLETLTDENIATQIDNQGGKKVLKDRRLFVNYMKTKDVNSVKELMSKLEDIDASLKKIGVEMTEADINVMIAGAQIENKSWSICGDLTTNKASVDIKNKFFPNINAMCNPPLPTAATKNTVTNTNKK